MVRKAGRIADSELQELFLRAAQGDTNALEHAVEAAEPLLAHMVKMYQLKGHRAISHEDLLQEARIKTITAIRRYDPCRGATPLGFVTLYVRTALRDTVNRIERREVGVLSLDAPLEDGENGTLHDRVGAPAPMEAGEMDSLIDRLPPGSKSVRRRKLPDDHVLLTLVKQGNTTAEIGRLYGVRNEAVTKRLRSMRRMGIDVPAPVTSRTKRSPEPQESPAGTKSRRSTTGSAHDNPAEVPLLPLTPQPASGDLGGTLTLPVPTWTFANAGAADLLTDMATKLISSMVRCAPAHMRLKIEVAPAETDRVPRLHGEQIGDPHSLPVPTWLFENAGAADQLAAMAAQLISSFSGCASAQMQLKIEVSPTV